jgi:CDP-glycerol glycerophosphotransferase
MVNEEPWRPDVSVVLISFNDAKRLPRALRSLAAQTLRNIEIIVVDDASTDDTASVVAAAMQRDARIRYVRLEQNSGGCSAPRNRGIAEARGTWVMFCDSDDVYERHAAKNLLWAVEEADADLGCGVADRVDVRTGKVRRWHAELHEPAVLDSIMERPELIADTISVNKIYRRAFLEAHNLRFPEGVLYEDQLFTIEAYALARRIVVLEQSVYRWYVERLSDAPSITQRRTEARNAASRVAVNRLIDARLRVLDRPELRRVKDAKFLRHDLSLHLASLLDADELQARAIMRELAEYVSELDLTSVEDVQAPLRIAVYHLLIGDLAGVRSAMRYLAWSGTIDGPIRTDEEGDVWACEYLADGPMFGGFRPRWWLDASELNVAAIAPAQRPWCHLVEELTCKGNRMRVAGTTIDAFGDLSWVIAARMVFLGPANRPMLEIPLSWTETVVENRSCWAWAGDARVTATAGTVLPASAAGMLALALRFRAPTGDEYEISQPVHVSMTKVTEAIIPRYRWPQLPPEPPDAVRIGPAPAGTIAWQAIRQRDPILSGLWLRLRLGPGVVRGGLKWLLQRVARLLPTTGAVVLASGDGRRFVGQPRALSEAWHASHPRLRQIWIHSGEPERFPAWARLVDRRSLAYHWIMARSRWWVDDRGIALSVRKGRGQRYLQAWTGTPVLRVGNADPTWVCTPKAIREPAPASIRRWNALLVASAHGDDDLADALGFTGARVGPGSPFAQQVAAGVPRGLPPEMVVPDGRPVILIAPTHPDLIDAGIGIERLAEALAGKAALLIRRPDGRPVRMPSALRHTALDISGFDDMARVIGGCDLFITDAANWVVDAAVAERPLIIVDPQDLPAGVEPLSRVPGFSWDLAQAGPVVRDPDQLVALVSEWLLRRDAAWVAEFSEGRARLASLAGPLDAAVSEAALAVLQRRTR